ncbi:hypothetical protein [Qipengyuania vesicularis]|uniref:hypothetical protein n=1 Tax=Qipengyuania vesicularis TaxID=2867232 RepID=UPI001C87B567|nr:hypothetical protein [Qipengyuania vesicularis]MBX7528162.1 hypothetical protein [Qipengyuania vesicularis]
MDRLCGDFDAFDAAGDHDNGFDDHDAHSNPPPSPVGQDERRMQVRAYNHWVNQLGDQNLPNVEDLEPEEMADFGPHSVVLDFSTGTGTPTIQFIGTKLRAECGLFDPIEELHEIPEQSLLSEIAKNYLKVVAAQAPVAFEAESAYVHRKSVAYRGILLPYSSDNETIDFVFAVVNWKDLADAATAEALLGEIDAAMAQPAPLPTEEPQVEDAPQETAEIVHFDLEAHKAAQAEPEPEVSEEPVEIAEPDPAPEPAPWSSDDNVLDMRGTDLGDPAEPEDIPQPSFGQAEEAATEYVAEPIQEPAASEPVEDTLSEKPVEIPRRKPAVDALGNPVGNASAEEDTHDEVSGGITTAADYGLPEWDEEEDIDEDVEDLVNPLANIDLNSRLLSLVNSHSRAKKTVDLATLSENAMEDDDEQGHDEERQLFKPKAPSIDTLLTPEEYDEDETEEVEAYEYDDAVEALPEFEVSDLEEPEADEGFSELEAPVEDAAALEAFEAEVPAEEPVADEAGEEEVILELSEVAEDIVEEVTAPVVDEVIEAPEETFAEVEEVAEEPVAEVGEALETVELAEWDELDEPLELTDEFVVEDEELVEAAIDVEEVAESEPAPEPVEPGSLTGLLAAVHELSEAARTTQDPGRRALYEAVGKAFDISIKAVLAAEGREDGSIDIAPLDLDEQFEEMKASALRETG